MSFSNAGAPVVDVRKPSNATRSTAWVTARSQHPPVASSDSRSSGRPSALVLRGRSSDSRRVVSEERTQRLSDVPLVVDEKELEPLRVVIGLGTGGAHAPSVVAASLSRACFLRGSVSRFAAESRIRPATLELGSVDPAAGETSA